VLEVDKISDFFIEKGDALELLKSIPDSSIDLVIADPPYNSKSYEWDCKDDEWQFKWLEEIKRIMKDNSSLYCFFAPLLMYGVEGWIRKNLILKNILVWFYGGGLCMYYGDDRYRLAWEAIFYATKSGKGMSKNVLFRVGESSFDVFKVNPVLDKVHPSQKPVKLIRNFILASSNEGDIVLDPFFGSGTVGVVSLMLGRRFIGFELYDEYFEIGKDRIMKAKNAGFIDRWMNLE